MNKVICIDNSTELFGAMLSRTDADVLIQSVVQYEDCMDLIKDNSYSLLLINTLHCKEWTLAVALIRHQSNIPIVLYSDVNRTADVITAFRLGVDDYILKKQNSIEIALRIDNLIKRYVADECVSEQQAILKFRDIRIDVNKREIYKGDQFIELTKTEFDLLYFFVRHKGQVLSREQLCNGVWTDEYITDDTNIVSHIHRLRMKLETNPAEPTYILTVRGVSYKFNSSVI